METHATDDLTAPEEEDIIDLTFEDEPEIIVEKDQLVCSNCTQSFENLNELEVHLFHSRACFFPLTNIYWGGKQLCIMCDTYLPDHIMLKKHCYESTECKKCYIDLYIGDSGLPGKPLASQSASREVDVVSSYVPLPTHARTDCVVTTTSSQMPAMNNKTGGSTLLREVKMGCSHSNLPTHNNGFVVNPTNPAFMSEMNNETSGATLLPGVIAKFSSSNLVDNDSNHSAVVSTTPALIPEMNNDTRSGSLLAEDEIHFQDQITEASTANYVRNLSQREAERSTAASNFTAQDGLNTQKKQLRSRYSNSTVTCQGCGRYLKPLRMRKDRPTASAEDNDQIKCSQKVSCICCKTDFINEDDKTRHLNVTQQCYMFMKERFFNGVLLQQLENYDSNSLNTKMCPFCLFQDPNVFSHVLIAPKCRQKLEQYISRNYSTASLNDNEARQPQLSTSSGPDAEPVHQSQLACNVCGHTFHKKRAYKNRTDRDSSKLNSSEGRQNRRSHHADDVYCFSCKTFLTSKTEIELHLCRPTRLLRYFWYSKAIWTIDQYQCKACDDKFFHQKHDLVKHMQMHNKNDARTSIC